MNETYVQYSSAITNRPKMQGPEEINFLMIMEYIIMLLLAHTYLELL